MKRSSAGWLASVLLVGAGGYAVSGRGALASAEHGAPRVATATFAKDVAPILYQNCASCHHAGEVAPFPLITYQDAKKRASLIAAVTESGYMPPWHASEPPPSAFRDSHHLSNAQIATLKAWAAEGAPEGDPRTVPTPPTFPSGWTLGQPDLVVAPKTEYTLAADGNDVFRCFVLPSHTTEDRYVAAIEVRPGNPRVVHHVIAFLDTSGRARQLEAQSTDGPGYSSFGGIGVLPAGALGGWVPGNVPYRTPEGVGTLLPKGADIVLQVHYHKDGKPEKDLTRVGIYFCKQPVDKKIRVLPVLYPYLNIPAGAPDYRVQWKIQMPAPVTVYAVMPHMHLLGKSMALTATYPDGKAQPLVDVPRYDYNWQTTYTYRQPIALPAHTKITLAAAYDNSESNPRNPSRPPKRVGWGEQTTDEMCFGFVWYTVDSEHLTQGKPAHGVFGFADNDQSGGLIKELFKLSAGNS